MFRAKPLFARAVLVILLFVGMMGAPTPGFAQNERASETGVRAEQEPGSRTHSKTWWVIPPVGSLTLRLGSFSSHLPQINFASISADLRTRVGSVFPGSFSVTLSDIHAYWVMVRPLIEMALDHLQKNFIALQRWEYRVIEVSDPAAEALEKQLNGLGNDGWECISIIPTPTLTRCTFKRKPMSRFRAGMQILQLFFAGSVAAPGAGE